jgi:hypothetical protein
MSSTAHAQRRALRFDTLEAIEAELDLLAAAHHAGTLRHLGNNTPGQVLHHLARWADRYLRRDLPGPLPLHVRLVGRVMKHRFLTRGFPAGLPGPDGQRQTEPEVSFEQGLDYLRRMHDQMRSADLTQMTPFLGRLTHDQIMTIHRRHCELHLAFLVVEQPSTPEP